MAERRMMSKKIIHSDAFLDMPVSTQNLYFHLLLEGDDDGFVNSPKRIQRTIGSSDDDLKLLLAKKFIFGFDSGVVVIKHWKMHNYIRGDRYKETSHLKEKGELSVKDNDVYQMTTFGIPDGSIGEVRVGEVRVGEVNKAMTKFEIFIHEIEKSFAENKIATFKSKINKKKETKEAFSRLEDSDECKNLFISYVVRLRNGASRLDVFITAYLEGNLDGIEHSNNKFNKTAQPQKHSIAWQMQQDNEMIEGEVL